LVLEHRNRNASGGQEAQSRANCSLSALYRIVSIQDRDTIDLAGKRTHTMAVLVEVVAVS
jgi:hypothetical protein